MIFVTLCFLSFFIYVQGVPRVTRNEVFMNHLADCKKRVEATEADVEILKNRQLLSTKPAQCLMACIKKKMGVMLEDNIMNISVSKESIEPLKTQNKRLYDQMMHSLNYCKEKEIPEKDECVAAKRFSDCIIEIRDKEKMYE